MKILINRNDNLGDIIYTLQLARLLKEFNSKYKIFFLVRDYAKPLFEFVENVDGTISWNSLENMSLKDRQSLIGDFDIFINAKASTKAAQYAKQAGIKLRIGNSHRIPQWLYCNRLVNIKRKKSSAHEVELNAQLLKPLLGKIKKNPQELFTYIRLNKSSAQKYKFSLPQNKINIICHPASNGNGREWPVENFISLIKLADPNKYQFILTGTKQEKTITDQIEQSCPQIINYAGKLSLANFIALISKVELLIASGTGPLHIAAAIGTKTIGLFPPIETLDQKRWGPIFPWSKNFQANKRCKKNCNNQDCNCMKQLTPEFIFSNILN